MPQIKKIGVLTGGGDCPGLNAAIRAVAKTAIYEHGIEVIGIEDAFLGVVEHRMRPLTARDVSGVLTHGGTFLGSSASCDPGRMAVGKNSRGETVYEDRREECASLLAKRGIDALVVIGGDGTMSVASGFVKLGVNCIGVPKTIDNDLVGTDVTIGFSTAVEVATEALDRLHTTAMSHHRVIVCEVMGRNAGWIALHSGVASGSDVIVIPEIEYDLEKICDYVRDRSQHGKRFSLICVSEGARPRGGERTVREMDHDSPDPIKLGGVGEVLADDIEERTGITTRAVVLGHVLRGGTPNGADRVLATKLGSHAVHLLMEGEQGRLVVMDKGEVRDVDILHSANKQRLVEPETSKLIRAARSVGTSFGD
jgi:ATP-dependent phosphofructokinase / diphosphate-dependent phosphofructokinase